MVTVTLSIPMVISTVETTLMAKELEKENISMLMEIAMMELLSVIKNMELVDSPPKIRDNITVSFSSFRSMGKWS